MFESPPFWMYVIGFLLLLGPLVTLHELGHYLVGRWFGVKAEAFSVGFGKEIAGFTDSRGTRWKLSALPLGGYVQFKGDMNPASVPDADAPVEEGSFQHAALWKRALIVAAGPVTNLVLAIAIFASFFAIMGKPVIVGEEDSRTIGAFAEGSVAQAAGLEVGDVVLAIDGRAIRDFTDLKTEVALHPGKRMTLTVERGGEQRDFPVTTARVERRDSFGNVSTEGLIGVVPAGGAYELQKVGIFEAIPLGIQQSWDFTGMMITGIQQILTGDRSVKELGGPLKIAQVSGQAATMGIESFIFFIALISINLGFINLLPIPMLDGGHLLFYGIEAVQRRPVSATAQEWAYRSGLAVLMAMMLLVTFNDLSSFGLWKSLSGLIG